jgi:Xaa-Pro aminopeptidase
MDPATYAERRAALRRAVPDGLILLMGSNLAPRNYADATYPFRQDSHFLYYVGVAEPGMAAVLHPDGREVLYGTPEHPDDLVWLGPRPVLGDHAAAASIGRTAAMGELAAALAGARGQGLEVKYLPPYRANRTLQLAGLLGTTVDGVADGSSAELVRAVAVQRSVKDDAEIAEIEEALSVTADMYTAAAEVAGPGRVEAEVAGVLQATALINDRQQAFNPIVSVRGEVLHNSSYGNVMSTGDLLVIDSGAESAGGYASDITRTLPVAGRFSAQQRDIYEIVLGAQEAAIAAVSPELSNREVHFVAARTIAQGLVDLGLMKGEVETAVAVGAHALFFPHGIGHMMGLDAHDMEDLGDVVGYAEGEGRSPQFGLGFLRLARQLEPGFVITIEPGIYFIPALIARWQAEGRHRDFINYDRLGIYEGFGGIRIEDDVLVTGDGHRVLGPSIPKQPNDVEAMLQG